MRAWSWELWAVRYVYFVANRQIYFIFYVFFDFDFFVNGLSHYGSGFIVVAHALRLTLENDALFCSKFHSIKISFLSFLWPHLAYNILFFLNVPTILIPDFYVLITNFVN